MKIEPKHEHLMNNSGVYQIRNVYNNKVYIGKTISFETRYKHHFTNLQKNNHHNIHLQNSYNLYNKDVFVFEIIVITSVSVEMHEWEVFWEKYYKTFGMTYNSITPSDDNLPNKILQICRSTGVVLFIHDNVYVAVANISTNSTKQIYDCCNGNEISAGNFHFAYATKFDNIGDIYYTERELLFKNYDLRDGMVTPIAQLHYKTNKILNVFLTMTDASKKVGVGVATISQAVSNQIKYCGGFKWKRISLDEYFKIKQEYIHYPVTVNRSCSKGVVQYCSKTHNVIDEFDSVRGCARTLGVSRTTLKNWILGKFSPRNNQDYYFKYVQD